MPGWRQRREAARSRSPDVHSEWGWSKEVCNWMHKWSWGKSSAAAIVRDAAAKDKIEDELVKRIAAGARHDKNAERLLESIVPTSRLPPTISIASSEIDTVLLPFDSFHWLRKLDARKFRWQLGAYDHGLEAWWAALLARSDGPAMWARHSLLVGRTPAELKWYVPLVIFDDAGPVANDESLSLIHI